MQASRPKRALSLIVNILPAVRLTVNKGAGVKAITYTVLRFCLELIVSGVFFSIAWLALRLVASGAVWLVWPASVAFVGFILAGAITGLTAFINLLRDI